MAKKLSIILTLILFVIVGCGTITINNDKAKEILIKAGSRVLAYQFLKKHPDQVETVKFYAQAMQEGNITQAAINTAIFYLSEKIGNDPSLHAAFMDLQGLIIVNVEDPAFNPDLIRLVAQGFIEGAILLQQ